MQVAVQPLVVAEKGVDYQEVSHVFHCMQCDLQSALVSAHFAKEEEVYLPLLDARPTADEAARVVGAMERAAQEARTPVG